MGVWEGAPGGEVFFCWGGLKRRDGVTGWLAGRREKWGTQKSPRWGGAWSFLVTPLGGEKLAVG